MSATDVLEELWRQQSCWSHAADRMKKGIERQGWMAKVVEDPPNHTSPTGR